MFQIFLPVELQSGFQIVGYVTVCVVCLKKITDYKLRKCAGCKLVFYCSKEHQKFHWPKHKQFCRAVQVMIIDNDEIGLFDNYVEKGFGAWSNFRLSLIHNCESILKRPLGHEERTLFLNPFVCKLCHIYKHQHMITCKECSFISYCSKEHQIEDKLKHSTECHKLKVILDFDASLLKPFTVSANIDDVKTLPTDMDYFISNCISMKIEPPVDKLCVGYYLSNSLTVPLTLIYIIEKGNVYKGQTNLVIHVVGSGLFESGACWCWEYIFHYFTNLQTIQIFFIGPESSDYFLPPILTCQNCQDSRSFKFIVDKDLYHDYAKRALESPDLIIAFNCGFHEHTNLPTYETWANSMPALCSYPGAVVAFTSYIYGESVRDLEMLKKNSNTDKLKFLVECEENPYRSLEPIPDWFNENGDVYYNNNFINIFTT